MLIASKQEKVYFPSNLQAPYLTETAQNAAESDDNKTAEAAAIAEEADAAAGGGLRRFGSSHRIGSLHQFLSPAAGSPPAVSAGSVSPRRTPTRTPARTPRGGALDSSSGLLGQDSQHSAAAAAAAAAAANKSILLQRYREEFSWGPSPGLAATRTASAEATTKITPDWRLRDRMKTVGVGLVLALNVGTDPPDVVKPHPCAVLQCWMNPLKFSRSKAKEMIGERLEQQYANARSTSAARPLRYRRTLDPTVEDVRNVCLQLRRQARNDRVLLHYNGHGVPRPTDHGEIWVFDKNHTEYIPLPVTDLRNWLGKPSIVVLDCSAAGVLLPFLVNPLGGTTTPPDTNQEQETGETATTSTPDKKQSLLSPEDQANQWVRETIVLAPCGPKELLPMDPAYPADIFTSCLTTPIPTALRWFVQRNPHSTTGLEPEAVDTIPGKVTDRKTPLGELNWIFTAVTDSIAWNVLPKHLFKRLFRQDLLVASLFRNFLLADRILRHLGCTPVSYPVLPSAADHPLWQSWDLACETLLFQLIKNGVLKSSSVPTPVSPPPSSNNSIDDAEQVGERPTRAATAASPMAPSSPSGGVAATEVAPVENVSSPFFSEQLTAFEVWLDFSEIHKMHLASGTLQQSSPEQLPVVLQVLLFQVHRIRALKLMRRFLDLGPWAVNLSLSLGIYPYVMKLLQSPQYKSLLVSLWASILSFDPSLRVDLLRDGAFHHFVQHLMWGLDSNVVDAAEAAKERTLAAFVLSVACHGYPAGQVECVRLNVHGSCCALLSSYEQGEHAQDDKTVELHLPAHFRLWLVICLASMVIDNAPIQNEAFSAGAHQRLAIRLQNDQNANVRAAVCYALGCLIGSQPKKGSRDPSQQDLAGITSPQQQQQQQQVAPSQASFAQGLVAPAQIPNMGLPNSIAPAQLPTNQLGQAHLRPTFAPSATTGVAGLALAGPQHMQAMQGGSLQPTTVATTSGAQGPPAFWNQTVQLRPTTQAAPIHTPYILQGQPLGAAGFLVGSAPLVGQTPLVDPATAFPIPVPEPHAPSVFEDRHRLELDLSCIEMLVKGTEDASVIVRYEACVGLACAVNKYLVAFVYVAGESVAADTTAFPALPSNLDLKTKQKFKSTWLSVRSLQKDDVFPPVSKAANDIVLFVNEHLLRMTADNDQEREIGKEGSSLRGGRAGMALAGISEDTATFQDKTSEIPTDSGRVIGTIPLKSDLRRVSSEVTNPDKGDSMKSRAELNQSNRQKTTSGSKFDGPLVYALPKSNYYSWQKDAFDYKLQSSDDALEFDPLSPEGARLLYEKRRNSEVKSFARKLSEHFSSLAPKPPKPQKKGLNFILEEEDEETALAMEEDLSKKKRGLELKETWLLQNEGTKMTSMVRFHPYENYLVSCDGGDQISSWDTSTGKRLTIFSNGNPEDSRMTTTCWINEKSQNILLVGSDDGAVRLWGGLAKPQNEMCSPALVSAFHALPMNAERRQSGLVCEWQPSSGTLVAAGSSKYINCWDMEAEKLSLQIDTNTAAPITSLTTAWDHDPLDPSILPPPSTGLSPSIVVAGLGDGALRIFDVRSHRSGQDLNSGPSTRQSRRHGPRATQYSEHKSWVVSTAFTNYANKYEIISGTLSGEVKAWDLRMSSSIRTVEVQRSVMTALAVHPRIPIMATGSHAQFIKLQTPDGDFLQVLRYHEKMANHRIGPVSCVAFHPHKPMLAAGATDNYIGVYAPKNSKLL